MKTIDEKAKDEEEIIRMINKYQNEPRWSLETNSMFYKLERMMRNYFNKYHEEFRTQNYRK